MATVSRMRTNPASLLVQVTHAERDVLDRRRHVVVRATSFHQSIRRRLTSPKTLLFAGGLGIFAERLTRRHATAPSNAALPRTTRDKLLPGLLKIIAFTRLWGTVFPAELDRRQRRVANDG